MLENDYFMRMINDLARALAKILFNKESVVYELPEDETYTATDLLYLDLERILAKGSLNEAENLLLDHKEELILDKRYQELSLYFYLRLNSCDDQYLEDHQYSREEVEQGLKDLADELGIPLDML